MTPLQHSVRFGLIGTSHPHSGMYQESLLQMPEVRVVAVYDDGGRINPALSGAAVYTDLAQLLASEELDAALVAVPNDQGAAAAVAVATARVPFLIDKPVCRTASEMRTVVQAVARTGVQCATGYINRFRPTQQRARAIVRSPEFGPVRVVSGYLFATDVASRGPEHYLFQRDRSGGGVLHWLGCHLIDAVRDLLGSELTDVRATLAASSSTLTDVEELGALTFRFESGAIGSIAAGYVFPHASASPYERSPKDALISVWSTRARLDYEPLGEELTLTWLAPTAGKPAVERFRFPLEPEPGYVGPLGRLLIEELMASVREGREPVVNERDNLRVLEVLDAVYGVDEYGVDR